MRNTTRRGLSVFASLIGILALASCYRDPDELRAFAVNHTKIEGRIKHLDCANHGATYYEFDVNGKNQAGRSAPGTVDCRSSKIGMPVVVYYYPLDPRIHSTLEPARLYAQEKGYYLPAWGWFLLIFPTYLAVVSVITLAPGKSRANRNDV